MTVHKKDKELQEIKEVFIEVFRALKEIPRKELIASIITVLLLYVFTFLGFCL